MTMTGSKNYSYFIICNYFKLLLNGLNLPIIYIFGPLINNIKNSKPMSQQDFTKIKEEILTIDDENIKKPNMPVGIALQEGEDLAEWIKPDLKKLYAAGLEEKYVSGLQVRIGACRYTQSIWSADYKAQKDAQKEWKTKSPEAYNLRDELVHEAFHATRKHPDLQEVVRNISEGSGHADMIQDLSSLKEFGDKYPDLFTKVGVDLSLFNKAGTLSEEMADLLAESNADGSSPNENKILRDKAYTYLKEAVDEIRYHGQHVFWRNDGRKKGYVSQYHKN